jgi:hypothetical protein
LVMIWRRTFLPPRSPARRIRSLPPSRTRLHPLALLRRSTTLVQRRFSLPCGASREFFLPPLHWRSAAS